MTGPQINTPASTVFTGPPVMGRVNQRSPVADSITVNFPPPGVYPYEVDYAKGGEKNLTLTMRRRRGFSSKSITRSPLKPITHSPRKAMSILL